MVDAGLLHGVMAGLVTGSYIALGAIGLGLVYNISKVPNFAHGELLMLGAYFALLVNLPWDDLPIFDRLARENGDPTTIALLVVLFAITFACTLLILYLLGGKKALKGRWWPIDVHPTIALVTHIVAAAGLGLAVAFSTPNLFGGLILATVMLAALTPLLDKVIFERFRAAGATLATMLIVTMGLAFFLRFTAQAYFTGSTRSYEITGNVTIFGTEINFTAFKEFDFFITDDGLTFHVFDTARDVRDTVLVTSYDWISLIVIILGVSIITVGAYWWRARGIGEYEAAQTIGPRIVGGLAGLASLIVLGILLGSSGSIPEDFITGTQIRTSFLRIGILGLAAVLMFALHTLLRETKLGKAMRASSDNLDLAEVTGIDTNRVMMSTWIIAGAFAAVAGVTVGLLFHSIRPTMGFFLLLPMFAAVILGGLRSIYGAILGSYVVGIAMEVGLLQFGLDGVHRVTIAFIVLIIVLLVKPEGLIGGR